MAYTTIDDPTAFHQTKLYTGNDSSRAITFDGNTDMQPDWSWFKARSEAYNHALFDSVRGTTKLIRSNQTTAEETHSTTLTAFSSNGFSLGGGDAFTNADTVTYASWHWKAGTAFSNDASSTSIGTIDSTGSASTAAGFSVVSWTGTGSAGTIKHGLSTVPKMIIVKTRSTDNIWSVYHVGLGNTHYIQLNEPDGPTDNDTYWSDTTPTSSVFSVGTASGVNGDGTTNIAYCFADVQGYSKMGAYTGNSSTDGTYVHLGFKPAFLMVKRIDASYRWTISDNKRLGYNRIINQFAADASTAENTSASYGEFDFTANGFKCRSAEDGMNVGDIVYMAFAENPFVTSTGVPATAR